MINSASLTRLAVLSALTGLMSGCALVLPDRIHYSWPEGATGDGVESSRKPLGLMADDAVAPSSPPLRQYEVIGVALSGGGARASVFGAAAIEVLAEAGIMQQATYLSSVSGGGFAASYYALKQPVPCAAGSPAGAPCTSESYAAFKEQMRHNFLVDMTFHQLGNPGRITSPTRRLTSLQDAIDEEFVNGAVFADLPASPILLINGARYDDARRFVFSQAVIPEAETDIEAFGVETVRSATFSQEGCPRATPGDFSVALAVAISAGFPPLLGPAAIDMPKSCNGNERHYWHLGDGGILDNTGVETVEDYSLRALGPDLQPVPPPKRVFIFSVDAGKSATPEEMMASRNLKLWTTDPGRIVEIVGMRAKGYRELALKHLRPLQETEIITFKMRYTDAELDTWPASCGNRDGGRAAIKAQVLSVPTNFRISECDADLMEMAARDVVGRTLRENADLLRGAGLMN